METREYYLRIISGIHAADEEAKKSGVSAEERARRAFQTRHEARMTCRAMMSDRHEVDDLHRGKEQLGAVAVGIAKVGVVGVSMAVSTRAVLDALAEADVSGRIQPADQVVKRLHHVAAVMERGAGTVQKHDVPRIVLAVKKGSDRRGAVDDEIVGDSKPQVGVEPGGFHHVGDQDLVVVHAQRARAAMVVDLHVRTRLGRHGRA